MQYFRSLASVLLIGFAYAAISCVPFSAGRTEAPQAPTGSTTIETATISQPRSPAGPLSGGSGWNQVFTDEFSASRLDTSQWTQCYWWDDDGCTNLGNNNQQWYTADNISIDNGVLALTAREAQVRGINGRIFPYTSGIVTTGRYYEERRGADRFSFTYGYVEVRARIPSGRGLWPAIWLLPSTHRSLPEIDIMEVLGHQPSVLEMHFHAVNNDGQRNTANRRVTVSNLSQRFHVYGLEWSPDAIIWYLDGVERWRYTDVSAIPREPMYLLINLAVGGTWPGPPDQSTSFPAEFLIDYVRIWQRQQ